MTEKNLISELAKSKSAAKRLAKAASAGELQCAIKNLQLAATVLEKSEAEKAIKTRANNLKKLKLTMKKLGLSPEDVADLIGTKGATGRDKIKKPAIKSKSGPLKD